MFFFCQDYVRSVPPLSFEFIQISSFISDWCVTWWSDHNCLLYTNVFFFVLFLTHLLHLLLWYFETPFFSLTLNWSASVLYLWTKQMLRYERSCLFISLRVFVCVRQLAVSLWQIRIVYAELRLTQLIKDRNVSSFIHHWLPGPKTGGPRLYSRSDSIISTSVSLSAQAGSRTLLLCE